MLSLATSPAAFDERPSLAGSRSPTRPHDPCEDPSAVPDSDSLSSAANSISKLLHHKFLPNGFSHEDTLTCGSCLRDFSLRDITKFIDHKVTNGCAQNQEDLCCSCFDEKDESGSEHSVEMLTNGDVNSLEQSNEVTGDGVLTVQFNDLQLDETTNPSIPSTQSEERSTKSNSVPVILNGKVSSPSENKENEPASVKKEETLLVSCGSPGNKSEMEKGELLSVKCATELNDQLCDDKSTDRSGQRSSKRVHKKQCRHTRRLCKHYQGVLPNGDSTGEMTNPTHMLQTTLLSQSPTVSVALFRATTACH